MEMEIIVSTPCRAWLTDLPEVTATAEKVVAMALADAALDRGVVEVGIRLTDDDEMRQLNNDYRHQDKATNVLSFVADGVDGPAHDGPLLLGDIVLAHGVVRAEALAQGKSLHDHYCHLLVHGTLHLLGHDHLEDEEAADMEAREVAILSRLGIADPYRPATAPASAGAA